MDDDAPQEEFRWELPEPLDTAVRQRLRRVKFEEKHARAFHEWFTHEYDGVRPPDDKGLVGACDLLNVVCQIHEPHGEIRNLTDDEGSFLILAYLYACGDQTSLVNQFIGEGARYPSELCPECDRLDYEDFGEFLLAFAPDDEDDSVWGHGNNAPASWEEQAAEAERRARAERKAAKQRAKATAQANAEVQAGAVPTNLLEIGALNLYLSRWAIRGRVQLKDETQGMQMKHLRLTIADISGDIEVSVDGPGGFSEDALNAEDFAALCASVQIGSCYQVSGGRLDSKRRYNTSSHMYEIRLGAAGTIVECEEPEGAQRPPRERTAEQVARSVQAEQSRKEDELRQEERRRQMTEKWKPRISSAIAVGETLPDRVMRRKVEEYPGQLTHGDLRFEVWAHGEYVTIFASMVEGGEVIKVSGPPIDAKQDRWERLA